MRQKDLNEAPSKKGKQPAVGPEGRPTVEPYGYVEPSQLIPGEKSEIKLEQAQELLVDVEQERYKLEYAVEYLKSAPHYQEQFQIVQGFMENLKEVESKLKAKIEELKKVANTIPEPVKKLFAHIEKNCSNYLKAVRKSKKFLYRGANGPDAYVAKSWDDRKPLDSKKAGQQLFDSLLAQQGFVALRGNSIFTTPYQSKAGRYGKLYVIFPIDGQSHFTYTNQMDLTIYHVYQIPVDRKLAEPWMKKFHEWLKIKLKELKAAKKKDYDVQFVQNTLEFLTAILKDPNMASSSYRIYDILVDHKKSWLEKGAPPELMKVKYTSLVSVESFNKKYNPSQTNLPKAMKDNVEVYVSGTYYALSWSKYYKWLELYFKGVNS